MLKKRSVTDYLKGKSLSDVEDDFNVSDTSILNWVLEFANNLPNLSEVNKLFKLDKKNNWTGILLLDAKVVKTHEGNYVELLAQDFTTRDLIGSIQADSETKEAYEELIAKVLESGYPLKALVSDLKEGIVALTQPRVEKKKLSRRYPRPTQNAEIESKPNIPKLYGIPHQVCCIHVFREVRKLLKPNTTDLNSIRLRYLLHNVLFAKSLTSFKHRLKLLSRFEAKTEEQYKAIAKVTRNLNLISTHLILRSKKDKKDRLYIPNSTNLLESTISQFEERFKINRKFKTKATAKDTFKLIALNYRFHIMKKAKSKRRKGKSPIHLSGAKNLPKNFLSLIRASVA